MLKMKNCTYGEVKIDEESVINTGTVNLSWTLFFRQMFVILGVWVIYFTLGLSFGTPTILISQLRNEANSSDAVSLEMESWLTSVHGYSCIPFVIILPIAAHRFGRKVIFILLCLNTAVANIIHYWGTTTVHVLISEIMQGVLLGSNITFLFPICSEYASPHYRGIFLTIKAALFYWGVWVANIVGTFFHWRNIGMIGIACSAYSLSAIYWPESPSWLAMKGRYEEAAAAHHWLKGFDEVSEKELENLIKAQKNYLERRRNHIMTFKRTLISTLNTISTRAFYLPLLLCVTIMSMYHFSGKLVCVMYAVQLIHQITNSEEIAYIAMLLLEGVTILSMSIGCLLAKYLEKKTLLLSSSSIAVVTLYVIALNLYLVQLSICAENKIVFLVLLVIFSCAISCGPLILASPIFVEIVSLRHQFTTFPLITLYSEILMATVLKLAPSIFRTFGLHGAFLFFAVFASMFLTIFFIHLPKTKGKSLQEIEDYFTISQKSNNVISLQEQENMTEPDRA